MKLDTSDEENKWFNTIGKKMKEISEKMSNTEVKPMLLSKDHFYELLDEDNDAM